jgi:hypothetical protein
VNDRASPVQGRCVRLTPDTLLVDVLYRPEDSNRRNSRLVAADQSELLPDLTLQENAGAAEKGVGQPKCCK